MLFKVYRSLDVAVAIGKHYSNDTYTNDKGETILINDVNAISWIAFGVQVMAY